MTVSLVTVSNVPILSTGLDYPLSTGPLTFTEDDLRDIVASQDDSAIRAPRLKLSRVDAHAEAINEPVFGTAQNMRLGDNDQTIYCDFVGVPEWLAEVLPAAYPNRSIEASLDVETVTGKKYRAVVTAVQLLGVEWPGISVLADLPLYYGSEKPEPVVFAYAAAAAASSTGGDPVGNVLAAVNVDDVRRGYYEEIDSVPGCNWWWIRAVQLSPMELIVDDDDGSLYRVPFKVKGEKITFEEPISVKMEYIDIAASQSKEEKTAASSAFAAGLLATAPQEPVAVFASRAESRPVTASTKEGDEAKVDITQLRTALEMPESATEDEVLAEAQKRIAASTAAPAATETEGAPDPAAAGTEDPATPVAASVPDGMVLVDKETLDGLKTGAEAGLRVEASTNKAESERVLAQAIQEGRIAPARRAHYAAAMENDREGTITLLTAKPEEGGLAPGLVPVSASATTTTEGGEVVTADSEGLPENLFPEISRIRSQAAASQGRPGNVFQSKEG